MVELLLFVLWSDVVVLLVFFYVWIVVLLI